ncbi:hypothetical protein [Teichococcus vastitatis]|uniref:hypothetical protein n=1 Tax=Teichococcus vastitatis TaxID=2307076 RepID=UPI001300ABB2|nr:hypothetical protein [Pseudoroseomonas vastitatis]
MQTLPLLIRLARQRADARRVALAEAERQHRATAERMSAHRAEVAVETARATNNPAEMAAWSAWWPHSVQLAQQLAHAQALMAQREDEIRGALANDFAEAKRLELAWEARQKAQTRHLARQMEKRAEELELHRIRTEG